MKDSYIRARIDEDLKNAFEQACEAEGLSASLVLRQLIKKYTAQHQQLDLLQAIKRERR